MERDALFNTASEISPDALAKEDPDYDPLEGVEWSHYKATRDNCRKKGIKISCKNCDQVYYAPLGCHLRTCPDCAKEYGDGIYREILEITKRLPVTATHKLRMITLGYGTKKGMRGGMKEARKALNKLWNTDLRPRLNPGHLPKKYGKAGVFASVEFGKKHDSVHIHALYYGPWVNREKLQARWKELTGSWYVDVRACRGSRGVREVIKYISKGITGNIYKAYEIEKALSGTRRLIAYGEFYNRKTKLEGKEYQFTCPCCGSTSWQYAGIVEMDSFVHKAIFHFRRLRLASLGGAVSDIWRKNYEGVKV